MKKILLIIILIMAIFQLVVLATAIDIGSAAINRATNFGTEFGVASPWIAIEKNNPANATGVIASVEIWPNANMTGVYVATFYVVSGNTLSCRDYEGIGNLTAGAKRTKAVNLDVQVGDYLGIYWGTGDMEFASVSSPGIWVLYSGWFEGEQAYSFYGDYAISLYGTGATVEVGGNAIFFGIDF